MRIAVMSDIHGNLAALEAVREDLKARGADQIVVLGDICLKGPHPRECLDRVQELGATRIILGNTDDWLANGLPPHFSADDESGRRMIDLHRWTREALGPEAIHLLQNLPSSHTAELGDEQVLFIHATPTSHSTWVPLSSSDEELEKHFQHETATLFVAGHVHTPGLRRLSERRLLVNVGSVGLPWDGDWRASYAILEGDGQRTAVNLIRVPYDIDRTMNDAQSVGMPWATEYRAALQRGLPF